ncbi:MAG: sulfurtransferase TusA family protein [Rhodocyclaceae bacterium]|nr:sulfurtransferase TusA family protein [Rhodocyclaceae bacterium]
MARRLELDIRGQICPSCLLLTLKAINEEAEALRRGEAEIVVTTDDRQATATIPAAAERMGYHAEVASLDEGYRIRVFGGR